MLLALAVLLALLVLAPSAGAATFCVNKTGPQCTEVFTVDQLQNAFNDANANQSSFDVVEIGPGTYDDGPYSVSSFTHVLGAGRDQTIITNTTPTALDSAVFLVSSPVTGDPRVADLTVRIGPGPSSRGLQTSGTTERIRIETAPNGDPGTGIDQNDGTLTDAEIILPREPFITGGSLSNTDIENVRFEAGTALFMQNGTARNVQLVGGETGLAMGFSPNRVENALIQVSGPDAVGVRGSGRSGGDYSLSHVTIAGDGAAGSNGITAIGTTGAFAPQTANTTVRNVLVSGFERSVVREGHQGDGLSPCSDCAVTQTLTIEYSVLGTAPVDDGGPGTSTSGPGVVVATDPRLADAAAGDFRLRHDSPAVDGGDPVGLGGSPFYTGESTVDLAGGPRIVSGRRDVGALEYQRGAPSAELAVPESALLYRPVTFTATATDPDPFDPLAFRFLVDGREVAAQGPLLTTSFTRLGSHRVDVTASDPTGLAGVAAAELDVAARPGRCANRRRGSRRRDAFAGSPAGDRLVGGRGNDRLRGGGGADCLSGGPGKDRLVGGRGRDRVTGGSGNDVIRVRDSARDIVNCGAGKADRVQADRRDRVRRCERR